MNRHTPRHDLRRALPLVAGALLLLVGSCSPGGMKDTARTRGDLAFARDSLELALAEYRLAVRQGGDDGASLARVAHTYVRLGRVDEAREWYQRAVEADRSLLDQAAADLLNLARDAATRRDRFQMASAMDAGLSFRPGVSVEAMALPLARHYFENGQYGRALPFYQKAMATSGDSVPELILEIGQAHEEIGDCERALVYFERFREMVRPWERSEVDWYIGSCSFRLASELLVRGPGRDAGDAVPNRTLEEALRLVERTIEVGEPRNLVSQAWFERGEILSLLGDCDGALAALEAVIRSEPSSNTALARRARERFDEIKFGRGLESLRPGRGCG